MWYWNSWIFITFWKLYDSAIMHRIYHMGDQTLRSVASNLCRSLEIQLLKKTRSHLPRTTRSSWVKLGSRRYKHAHTHIPTPTLQTKYLHILMFKGKCCENEQCMCECVCVHSLASVQTKRDDHNSASGRCYRRKNSVAALCTC